MPDLDWWPADAKDPAFTVQRQPYGAIEGGDYVRARSGGLTTLPQTAIRFSSKIKGWNAVAGKAFIYVRPGFNPEEAHLAADPYETMVITWGWPTKLGTTWLEVSLVRSAFGKPTTPQDGQTVFRATRDHLIEHYSEDGNTILAPIVSDRPLLGGRWYYYSVFFKTTPVDWVLGMSMGSPLPKDYHHADHLWDHIPPWYHSEDDKLAPAKGEGPLRKFTRIFGYELDTTREFVEQWQQIYHIDFAPMRLLIPLGKNFDVAYESGLGDIRYRGLIGNVAKLYNERGTGKGLKDLVQAASQYEAEITGGNNIMLLPQDSDFAVSTGHWTAPHPDLIIPAEWDSTVNVAAKTIMRPAPDVLPPTGTGRGVMEIMVSEIPA